MTRRELLRNLGVSLLWGSDAYSDEDTSSESTHAAPPPSLGNSAAPSLGENPFGGFLPEISPSVSFTDPAILADQNWSQGTALNTSGELGASNVLSMRLLQSPGDSLHSGAQDYDVFVYAAISEGVPGPLRPGAEVEVIGGAGSRSGPYGSLILAGGGEAGGEANYIGKFGGIDLTVSAESLREGLGGDYSRLVEVDGIEFNFSSAGAEVPVLGGLGITLGRYYTGSGETGLYRGGQFHLFGFSIEFGFGGYRPSPVWGSNAVCRP